MTPNVKPQNQKFKEVQWIDVQGIAEWQTINDLMRRPFPMFSTRGWILHHDNVRIIVAATREMNPESPEDTTYGDITIIPVCLVKRVKRVDD